MVSVIQRTSCLVQLQHVFSVFGIDDDLPIQSVNLDVGFCWQRREIRVHSVFIVVLEHFDDTFRSHSKILNVRGYIHAYMDDVEESRLWLMQHVIDKRRGRVTILIPSECLDCMRRRAEWCWMNGERSAVCKTFKKSSVDDAKPIG